MLVLGKTRRAEKGQALVEMALLIPVLAIMGSLLFDVGRYYVLASNVQAAADAACRQAEAAATLDEDNLRARITGDWGTLGRNMSLTVSDATEDRTLIDQHIYNPINDAMPARPSTVSQHRAKIRVSYRGNWVSPVLSGVDYVANHGTGFEIAYEQLAVIDTTVDTW